MLADGSLLVCNLSVQVAQLKRIGVNNAQTANSGSCQVQGGRTAQAPGSNDQDGALT